MPLINSIVKTVLKQQLKGKLLIEEADGSRYEYDPGPDHIFIEGETLEIRVDGLTKNLELDGTDTLMGVVVNSTLDPENAVKSPFEAIQTGDWNPVELFGERAAESLFPVHTGKTYREIRFRMPEMPDEAYREHHNRVGDLFNEHRLDEAILEISWILCRYPWMLDCYHILGNLSMEHKRFVEAEKYFTLGISIAEMSLPGEDTPFILSGRFMENSFYLALIQSMGDMNILMEKQDVALEYYRKCLRIDPQDYIGTRFLLKEITGDTFPATGEHYKLSHIEPYAFINEYEVPIRDTYDPMSKPNANQWSEMSELYRRIIIGRAHEDIFDLDKMSDDDMEFHCNIHVMAETALVNNVPKDSRLLLARYMAGDHDRHEAVHLLGRDLVQAFMQHQQQQQQQQQQAPGSSSPPEPSPE